jgi:hypothetical protein
VSAATYLVLAAAAVSIARHPGGQQNTEDSMVESFTRDLLGHSYGRVCVFAVGAVLIGVAAAFLWKAISASFTSQLAHRAVGPVSFETIVAMGRIGWVGRSAMMSLIGFFLCRAAVMFDADEAQGLGGAGTRQFLAQGCHHWPGHCARRRPGDRPARLRRVLHPQHSQTIARRC